ncbi:carboxypeptidase-like regulatory domain-containing protein [Chloroflexus sp.]|uniref:carboxypeptidase-like regulatory domain-containing protein n=1 Tax=Chloroflexus sp. TaxID=1904827 RepID=UPI002ACE8D56|nr:carboxypeptidase-like regulatory domain-containing protein [Chloroflexus sp.]
MSEQKKARRLSFDIPLDATGIADVTAETPVKVVVASAGKILHAGLARFDKQGRSVVRVELSDAPDTAQIIIGPPDAADDDLPRLQTISRTVSLRAVQEGKFKLDPIVISPYYWHWWRRWCREFTITGRVICPNGQPVPGARVCAFDVDWWWWWASRQQIDCVTTDANGSFTMKFRWCCGWWPWWWWRIRHWQLDPSLIERLRPVIEQVPDFPIPIPDPRPSLDVFAPVLARDGQATALLSQPFDPANLPALRERLLPKFPLIPELEQLRIWPWAPWQPWWDCSPDIIFRVTQVCQGEVKVIVDETIADTRWNIPTNLSVTLVANEQACCIDNPPPPEGNCVVVANVCSSLTGSIGGNLGASATPAGYLNPGVAAIHGDRPFAGTVLIGGLFGSAAQVDFYEFEWATNPAGPWQPMPAAAVGNFKRTFWGPALPAGVTDFHDVSVDFTPIDGRLVAPTREYFEANNGPGTWGMSRFWVSNRDLLLPWLTANTFGDGVYYLRLVGYRNTGTVTNPQLGAPQILPICNTERDNYLALAIDNSTSTLEPAADIVAVRINGNPAGACATVNAGSGGTLEIDFIAYDVDRHLAFYTLEATYGKNGRVNLLACPGATLTPIPLLPTAPAADFVGPDYGAARAQGAAAPHWRGGGLRLTIPNLSCAFPQTCCYQIELRVYKRTIVSCNYDYHPRQLSFYSLTVAV